MPLFSKGLGKENHLFRLIHEHSLYTTPGWKFHTFSNANNPDEGVTSVVGLPEPAGGLSTDNVTGYNIDWVSWSGDGSMVALNNLNVATNVSRFDILNYSKNTNSFSLRYTLSPGTGRGIRGAWNPSGTTFAASVSTTPYIRTWNIGTASGTLIVPSSLPASAPASLSWNNDGSSLALTVGATVIVYNRSGDTYSLVATISPSLGTLTCAQFSPDGTKLAIIGPTSPKFKVYNRSGDTFSTTGVTTPTLSNTVVYWCDWNAAGDKIAIGASTSPVLMVFTRSGDTYTQVSNTFYPGTSPTTRWVGWAGDTTLFASFNNNINKAVQWWTLNPNGINWVSSGSFAGSNLVQTPGNTAIYREPG